MLGELVRVSSVIAVFADEGKVVERGLFFHIMIVACFESRVRLYFILKCFDETMQRGVDFRVQWVMGHDKNISM